MPALNSFSYLSLRRWCRPVDSAAALIAGDNVLLKHRDGGFAPFGPPDAALEADRANIERWGDFTVPETDPVGFALDAGELFPYLTRDFAVFVDDVFMASLTDVQVQRANLGRERYLVLLERGIVAAETHGAALFADKFSGLLREMIALNINDATLPVKIYQESPVDTVVDEPCILLCDIWMHNYCHWILEVLSRLWFVESIPELADVPVMVPDYPPGSFQAQILDAALGSRRRIPFPGQNVRFRKLYFPTMLAPGGYSGQQARWTDRFMRERLGLPPGGGGGRRLLISRADSPVRRIANEDQLMERLAPLGFERRLLSGLSVREQISLFGEAETIITPHGAGCANLLFAPPGTKVIEIVPASAQHPMFWMLSKQSGHRYGRLVAADEGPQQAMRADPDAILALLNHLANAA